MNMLKDFLSEETFRKGIIHYLKKFTYRNAKNDDLWHSLSNVSHRLSYRRLLVSLNSDKLIMKAFKEPGGLQSMGSEESDTTSLSLSLFTFMHWRRKWQPTPVFLPGESQGRGSLVGCRLWGRTESDMTEVT